MQNSDNQLSVTRRLFINRLVVVGSVAAIGTTALAACGDSTATTAPAATTVAPTTTVAATTKAATTTSAATTTAAATTTVAATTTSAGTTTAATSASGFIDLGAATDFAGVDKTPKQVSLDTIKTGLGKGFVIKSGSDFAVLSDICTHQGCEVAYDATKAVFACPCHGSTYKLTGEVINGPAKLPLASYATKVDGGRLMVATKPSN